MEKNRSYTPIRVIFIIFSVIVMALIFRFSCENSEKSSSTSGNITEFVVEHVVEDYHELPAAKQKAEFDRIDHIVRKNAHFSIYAALGFCVSFAVGRRRLLSKGSLLNIAICFLYACSDEIHQHFVPGRACMFTDVLIDTSGGLTGMLFSMLIIAVISLITGRKAKSS